MDLTKDRLILSKIIKLKESIKKSPLELEFIGIVSDKDVFDNLKYFFKDIFQYEDYAYIYYHGREIKVIFVEEEDNPKNDSKKTFQN